MEVQEAVKRKEELEKGLANLVMAFEEATGLIVRTVEVSPYNTYEGTDLGGQFSHKNVKKWWSKVEVSL